MKHLILLSLIFAFSAQAEEYKAPSLQSLDWQKQKNAVIKSEEWNSDYTIKTLRNPDDPASNAGNIRKPSSGETDGKPKFWKFQKVK